MIEARDLTVEWLLDKADEQNRKADLATGQTDEELWIGNYHRGRAHAYAELAAMLKGEVIHLESPPLPRNKTFHSDRRLPP